MCKRAFGVHNLVTGMLYLTASLIAGACWALNPDSAFLFAAGVSAIALAVFLALRPDRRQVGRRPA